MPNRRHNKQVPGFKIGGRVAKMKVMWTSTNGKPIKPVNHERKKV